VVMEYIGLSRLLHQQDRWIELETDQINVLL
jgi:hypothetical protein